MNGQPDMAAGEGEPQAQLPSGLQNQARLAVFGLFSSWLISVLSCWPIIQDEPAGLTGLLPGLLVAIHMTRYLSGHLADNHRPLEPHRLFASLGAANWISLGRAAAVVLLAGFLPCALLSPQSEGSGTLAWAAGMLYLFISLADLCDGYAARRQNRQTELGKGLDIETDAAGLLIAGLVAVGFKRLPVIYLLVGLAYYLFIFGIRQRQKRGLPVVSLRSRPSSRIIAGCQMGLVGLALMPVFHPVFTFLAAYIFMTPLLLGFLRDWLVVSCRLQTDDDQRAEADRLLSALMVKLPLVFRLIILMVGIKLIFDCTGCDLPPAWLAILVPCFLAAAAGFAGRSAGFVLVLLLGSYQSPLGVTFLAMVLFAAAAALLLSGSGLLSLWSPEERLLYRRGKSAGGKKSEPHDYVA